MSVAALVARSARYLAPIAIVSAIAWLPIGYVAFGVPVPANAAQARIVLRIAWSCAGGSLFALLLLVGAVAPIVRAAARPRPPSQIAALVAGLAGLARAFVPALVVAAAIAMGFLALAVPGLLLLALLVLAPASEASGASAKIADSVAIVRTRWRAVVGVLAVAIVAIVAVVLVQQLRLPIPLGKAPKITELATFPPLVRMTALAIAAIVPLAAVTLAAIHTRARST